MVAPSNENNRLQAESDHLTVFDFKADTWQAASLPSVDSFQVSSFTGAGTYEYAFWVPPAQAGMSPDVLLTYNSQVVDYATAFTQASWVGLGWSLETGSVDRNMHESNDDETDDTFSVSVAGISSQLLPISQSGSVTTYATADQSFVRVEYDSSSDQWTLWTKEGTIYKFEDTTRTHKIDGCVSNPSSLNITWRWSLTKVTISTIMP
jgi:hypothetical protein